MVIDNGPAEGFGGGVTLRHLCAAIPLVREGNGNEPFEVQQKEKRSRTNNTQGGSAAHDCGNIRPSLTRDFDATTAGAGPQALVDPGGASAAGSVGGEGVGWLGPIIVTMTMVLLVQAEAR